MTVTARRSLVLLAIPLFLVACGSSKTSTSSACDEQFWNGTFGLCLPKGWKVLEGEALAEREVPEEVVAAFQSDTLLAGQYPTVIVTREELSQVVDTSTYSRASIRAVSALPGYSQLDQKPLKTLDDLETDLHIFRAQPQPDEPERKFYQVSAVKGENGYSFTALTPVSITADLEKQILAMLQNVTFTEPGSGGGNASSVKE